MKNDSFVLTPKSTNQKTGTMAVSTSCSKTCPDSCPFKDAGCYGNYGPLSWMWRELEPHALNARYDEFLNWVRDLPSSATLRHNQVGDFMGADNMIDVGCALKLVDAASHLTCAYAYTHYPVIPQPDCDARVAAHNSAVIELMNSRGFIVNVSANSLNHGIAIVKTGIKAPVASPVQDHWKEHKTVLVDGVRVIVCPAMLRPLGEFTCTECHLCMKAKRRNLIVFPAHGSGKRRANAVCDEWDEMFPLSAGNSKDGEQ